MKKFLKVMSKFRYISIIKTFMFNIHYFGVKGVIFFPVLVSKNIKLRKLRGTVIIERFKPGIVNLGFGDVGIFDKKLDKGIWDNTGEVFFKGNASIGHGSKISNSAKLILGENFNITAKSEIVCTKEIKFGENCLVSWDVLIMDTDFHSIHCLDSGHCINSSENIYIGNHVWVGCRSLILKGSNIPSDTVIAANSTVTKKLETTENTIVGSLNKVIKNNISWEI